MINWSAAKLPQGLAMEGRYCRVESLSDKAHAAALFEANSASDAIWDFLPYGPFPTLEAYREWVKSVENLDDTVFVAVFDKEKQLWSGVASFLRIAPEMGSIEIGHINFSPSLQKSRAATEANFLMMNWVFDAGYRRYEWKCDAANIPSRRAAQRFGFSFEGVFRKALIIKNHNRDTAWFALIDDDWSKIQSAFGIWLDPANFDDAGNQKIRLRDLTQQHLFARDPALLAQD